MAAKKDPDGAVVSELERLRDILYGEHRRETHTRLDDLQAELGQFRRETLRSLGDLDAQQANQLETTRQNLEDKVSALAADMQREIEALRADFDKTVAALRDEMTARRVLGQLLTDLGHSLQDEAREP